MSARTLWAAALAVGLLIWGATPAAAQLWTEDFESYPVGIGIAGQGPWQTWDSNPDPTVDALVTSLQAFDGTQSLAVNMTSDIVRKWDGGLNQGVVVITAHAYVPSTATGNLYFILLNTYHDNGPYDWSVQLNMSPDTGEIISEGGSAGGNPGGPSLPLLTDQWVEIRVEIDLDNNLHDIYYGGTLLEDNAVWSGAAINVAAMDLFADGITEGYYDGISMDTLPPCGTCCPFETLTCSSDCATGDIVLDWTSYNPGGFSGDITIRRDGTIIATVPGTQTTYTDPAVPAGSYNYLLTGDCGGGLSQTIGCAVVHAPTGAGVDDVIYDGDNGGDIDSATALKNALEANGRSVLVIGDLLDPCFPAPGTFESLWVLLGTFPENHQLTQAEGTLLATLTQAGVPIYIESGDHWGFDPDTTFRSYDGVGDAADGDDSFTAMIGLDSTYGLDLTGLDAVYNQDQTGNDWTDQIDPSLTDLGGPMAGVVWDESGGTYSTGIFYASVFAPVIDQSWEFGGYGGDQTALAGFYLFGLGLIPAPPIICFPPTGVGASSDCAVGDVTLSWTNGDTYDSIDIDRDGTVIATLPGGDTSYVDAGLAAGSYTYTVIGHCGVETASNSTSVMHAPIGSETDFLFAPNEPSGDIDSASALMAAHAANGVDVLRIPSLDYACFPTPVVLGDFTVWVQLGTFPNQYSMSDAEGTVLATLVQGGYSVYIEGGDVWGFSDPTPFADYDGVEGTFVIPSNSSATDGDDSFTSMDGMDYAGLLLSDFVGVPYNQDQFGNDWTDQIFPTGTDVGIPPDLGGTDAGVIWVDPDDSYNTGVFYNSTFGNVIAQSWEFGGFGGDQADLADRYRNALQASGVTFVRGECNNDGVFNIADAIFLLGFLFPGGGPPVVLDCQEACDTNNDNVLNIADPIAMLGALFPGGGPPFPIPAPTPTETGGAGCGPEPDGLTLGCDSHVCFSP